MNSKFYQIENHIENIEHNIITPSPNIIEADIDTLKTPPQYSIAHTISADLQHNTDLSNRLTQKYGNMSYVLDVLELIPGEITTIDTEHRYIHYLISKEKYNIPISYIDVFDNLYNLKNFAIKEKYEHIALCVENLTNNELKWEIIKNMIFEIFNETEIHLLLCYTPDIIKNKETNIISNIKNPYNTIDNTNNSIKNNYPQFNKIFYEYQIGENVKSDGNCGLFALTNAINDNKPKKIITLADILNILELSELPNY
ncbi:Uncharacterized protein FWK35_00014285 [Aphis craccivora]|uniref:Uncharacterized protein n=1 Tax=Aphis craccivora TaxID=307492 RepID=A0A6G0YBY7_APHCR|nr:Uncharacterized protein FWK35_00014285 [Aphis craccivora]